MHRHDSDAESPRNEFFVPLHASWSTVVLQALLLTWTEAILAVPVRNQHKILRRMKANSLFVYLFFAGDVMDANRNRLPRGAPDDDCRRTGGPVLACQPLERASAANALEVQSYAGTGGHAA